MFNIITDFILTKNIKIDKLGITFRKLRNNEKKLILNQIDSIYLKNKKLINYIIKNYNIEDELNLSIELLKYDELTRKIVKFCFFGVKSGFSLNSLSKIKKILERVVIIECDKDIISEYLEEDKISKLVSNILSLYDIYSKNIRINEKVRLNYDYILTDNIINPNEEDYYQNLIFNLVASFGSEKRMKKMVELSEDYLLQLQKFISKLNKNQIRRFLTVVDLMYANYSMIQNSIVNRVTIIESILLNEENDKRSNFILKTGLILKCYTGLESEENNRFLNNILGYTYDIRSAIVHGNEEKILDIFNAITQKNKNIISLIHNNTDTYISKKNQAMILADTFAILFVRAVIKYWIDNPSIISFMKNRY